MTPFDLQHTIKKVSFETKGMITVHLTDGRIINSPLKYYPGIKKLSLTDRKKIKILDDTMIMFKAAQEVYHIEDFLGKPEQYKYSFA